MTTRRCFLLASAFGAIAPACVLAQPRSPRIGVLAGLSLARSVAAPPLVQRLSELGYREGAGMVLEYRHSSAADRQPALARELIERKCDLIFALVSQTIARAFRDARTSIPVVFTALEYDPVEKGIIDTLRRPGANMTGVYSPFAELTAKRLEVALEVLPGASRFLVLADAQTRDQLAALRKAAEVRRAQLIVVEQDKAPYDFAAAFEIGRQQRVEGFIALSSAEFASRRAEISKLLTSHRIPAFGPSYMALEPGSLASYYQHSGKLSRRAAELGVLILKGAKPADIPVEQSDEFELVVNLKTAKALGVKIPYSVMARATKVIE